MPCARRLSSKRAVGDRDAVREAGRAARILQIGDVVGARRREARRRPARCRRAIPSRAPATPSLAAASPAKSASSAGIEEQRRVAAVELDLQLVDIGFAAAEAGRQRQRHRPRAGIDRAEEAGGEFGPGLGDQRDAVAGLEPERDEAAGVGERILAQLGIRIGARQRSAGVVEIEAAAALRGIIERLAEGREIGDPARQVVEWSGSPRAGQGSAVDR